MGEGWGERGEGGELTRIDNGGGKATEQRECSSPDLSALVRPKEPRHRGECGERGAVVAPMRCACPLQEVGDDADERALPVRERRGKKEGGLAVGALSGPAQEQMDRAWRTNGLGKPDRGRGEDFPFYFSNSISN